MKKKTEEILEGFSMRQKYEELLLDEIDLPLPEKYKHLLNIFEEIDRSINLLKNRAQATLFSTISAMIERQIHRQVTTNHLQRILHLVPAFYIHKWEMRKGKMELNVEIPHNIKVVIEMMENDEPVQASMTGY